MKLPRLHRTPPGTDAETASATDLPVSAAATGSTLGLDDWHGSWPVDDAPAPEGPEAEVPLFLNPGSPTIGPS